MKLLSFGLAIVVVFSICPVVVECLKRSQVQMAQTIQASGTTKTRTRVASSAAPISVTHRLIAGGAARSLSQMTLYPIDAMRTLAQTRDGRTLADVGIKALVRGCGTTSMFALFMGSIQFAVFGACRNTIGPLAASAVGAFGSCIVSIPQEVIKQRLVTGVYNSFREAVATIYKTDGIVGFYSAWKPTVLRNVPFVMTTFTSMDYMKRRILDRNPDKQELTILENLGIGIGAAMLGVLVTNPADVVKTRMMTQAASVEVPYASAMDCLITIIQKEGPMAFFAGVKQRSLYICLLWGMSFALNGGIQQYLSNQQQAMQK